ncbi:MAG TPA: lycopene beta-cyclase CrtY [Kofleriaceae bacterium]|nr:lycopene beta-cyclase CrtY [Kofleriaceae bacterium]
MTPTFDYALVGGGLQNGLVALAVRALQPAARIALIERGDAPGGNHTWCFHAGDVSPAAAAWIDPLVVHRWPGYDVAFASHARRLDAPYACVTAGRLAEQVTAALARPGSELLVRTSATDVGRDRVEVRDAAGATRVLRATAVIDARGPDRLPDGAGGWQKFVGQEVTLAAPHGLERPILMDARVPQLDGYRFVYVLPLAPRRLLVEDTYFSDRAHLDVAGVRAELAAYADARGWTIDRVDREEVGVLPMPLSTPPPSAAAPLVAGYAGGWFHPVTAYSFPIAARLAEHVAGRPAARLFGPELERLARRHGRQLAFAGRLNRMLFRWCRPADRHHVLARFYRLPAATIARFYALELTALDRARILLGRPPAGLSLRAALGGTP